LIVYIAVSLADLSILHSWCPLVLSTGSRDRLFCPAANSAEADEKVVKAFGPAEAGFSVMIVEESDSEDGPAIVVEML
jgi:hypothetical protein